jgi:hypothetical protein
MVIPCLERCKMITNNEEVFQSKYYQNYYVSKEGNIYSAYVVGGKEK